MIEIPNAFVRGLFSSLHEPGIELPSYKGKALRGHAISPVLRPEEIEQIGGADKITERGKNFRYNLGPIKTVVPAGWDDVSKVWFCTVNSPEVKALRRSYGLSELLNDNKHELHITIAIRRKNVLGNNDVAKFAQTRPLVKIASRRDTRHTVITGVSGAGKTTLAKQLAEKLNLPIHHVDKDDLWRENKKLADDPERYTEGTKAFRRYRSLRKKLVSRALAHKTPHIVDGAQCLVDCGMLQGHRLIVIDADEATTVKQRLQRDRELGKLAPDEANRPVREAKARYLFHELKYPVAELKRRPGVEGYLAGLRRRTGSRSKRSLARARRPGRRS